MAPTELPDSGNPLYVPPCRIWSPTMPSPCLLRAKSRSPERGGRTCDAG